MSVIVAGLLAPIVVMACFMLAASASGHKRIAVVWAVPVAAAAMLGGLWWVLRRGRGWGWRDCGFVRPRRSLWHLWWEIPTLTVVSLALAAGLGTALGVTPGSAGSTNELAAADHPVVVSVLLVTMILLVPLAEEIIFRGVIYGWLSCRLATPAAVVVTGVAFGAVHVLPAVMLYIIPHGIGMTAMRAWHGTLWASYIAHAVNNALVASLVLAAVFG